ncbi:MAG: leucyl/phenylalanyl-tRNA--protein transferase [Myxococcota bacterium]
MTHSPRTVRGCYPCPVPIYQLAPQIGFPDPRLAEPSGLLAVGGDLSAERLLLAYQMGIFPWFGDGQPILWWCPDPRTVLHTAELHVGRSLRKRERQAPYRITLDQAFSEVILKCADTPRPGQDGTWITQEMADAYELLHQRGHAHSVEAWNDDGALVGGVYGVQIGHMFFGESMFALEPDASKLAFIKLVRQLAEWGMPLIDCQMPTDHLARFGARDMAREDFLRTVSDLVSHPGKPGPWSFDPA